MSQLSSSTSSLLLNNSTPNKPMSEALVYLQQVKENCSPTTYANFLDIMVDFKTKKADAPQTIDRVVNLLKDTPQLVQGFNVFLPPKFRIGEDNTLHDGSIILIHDQDSEKDSFVLDPIDEARDFLERVKATLSLDSYKDFITTLNLRFKGVSFTEIQSRIHDLLSQNPELINAFDSFVPCFQSNDLQDSNGLSTGLYDMVQVEEEDSCKTIYDQEETLSLPMPTTFVQIVDETTTLLPSTSTPRSTIDWTRGILWSVSMLVCLMFIFGIFSWNYVYLNNHTL